MNIGSLHEQLYGIKEPFAIVGYCKSNDQRADIFTKALEPQKWPHALDLLGIVHDYGNSTVTDLASIEVGEDSCRVSDEGPGTLKPVPLQSGVKATCAIVDDIVAAMREPPP